MILVQLSHSRAVASSSMHTAPFLLPLAKILTRGKNGLGIESILRLSISNDLTLRVFRMNWRAKQRGSNGAISAALSISQVAIIEEIIWPVCERFVENQGRVFSVYELVDWIKEEYQNIFKYSFLH